MWVCTCPHYWTRCAESEVKVKLQTKPEWNSCRWTSWFGSFFAIPKPLPHYVLIHQQSNAITISVLPRKWLHSQWQNKLYVNLLPLCQLRGGTYKSLKVYLSAPRFFHISQFGKMPQWMKCADFKLSLEPSKELNPSKQKTRQGLASLSPQRYWRICTVNGINNLHPITIQCYGQCLAPAFLEFWRSHSTITQFLWSTHSSITRVHEHRFNCVTKIHSPAYQGIKNEPILNSS